MDDGIVDTAAAIADVFLHIADMPPVCGKNIERQGLGTGLDKGHGFLGGVIGHHRQNRRKQLLAHSGTVRRDGTHNRRRNLQCFGVFLTAEQNGFSVQNFGNPVKMPPVDDSAIVGILQGIFSVHFPNGVVKQRQEPVLDGILNQKIVRRHTGLSAVEVFAKGNALGGNLQIGGFVHNTGTFSAHLQGHRCKMLGSLLQHQLSNGGAAGKENIVEFLLQKALVFRTTTFDHCHIFLREHSGNQLFDDTGGGGSIGAGL